MSRAASAGSRGTPGSVARSGPSVSQRGGDSPSARRPGLAGTSPGPEPTWSALLRAERLRLGLTQVRVARLAGVSPEAIRKYECGTRTPARASLNRVIEALEIPQSQARAILTGAGFAAADTLFSNSDYYFSVEELPSFVEQVPWPQFVTNNLAEIVAANAAAQALWRVDFNEEVKRRPRARLNFLSIVAEQRFSQRIVNWEECVATLISVLRAIPQYGASLDPPGRFFQLAIEEFVANDPGALPGLLKLWEATPAQTAKVRWMYRVVWREPDVPDLRFLGIVTTASEPDAIAFNDWIPADAESHTGLERVLAERAADRPGAQRPGVENDANRRQGRSHPSAPRSRQRGTRS